MVRTSILAFLFGAAVSFSAAAGPWYDDLAAAQKAAQATGHPILVDVTGSDWCPPCQQMDAEVLSRADFLSAAQARFVLLRVDFPRNIPQTEARKVANRNFASAYPFEGFPTFFVLDPRGTPLGRQTGYLAGGVPAFLALVDEFAGRAPALASLEAAVAQAAPGAPRAKAQDALFRQAEAWDLAVRWGDLPLKIVKEDADGQAGLKARYQTLNAYDRLVATWSDRSDFRTAVDDLEALATRAFPWPDLRQRILFTKALVLLNALGDEFGAREALWTSRALDPASRWGAQATDLLDRLP